MRILGLDIGSVRVGVAVSDPGGILAVPVETVDALPIAACTARIGKLATELKAERIVVGLPLELDGHAGGASRRTRAFSAQLASVVALPITEWDERLTSVAAERALLAVDLNRAKRRAVRDQAAAVLILQAYLDHLRFSHQPTD